MSALSLAPSSARNPVWRADLLHAGASAKVVATGHAALDAELPGGGWPLDGMVELLQPVLGGVPLWPLLLPALAAHRPGRAVVLVGARLPYLPALAAAGLPPQRVLWVPDECLWAAEQALRCADVAAVLAWLPHARQTELRRLHLAAAQRGDGLLFVVRPAPAAREASPAPLRLRLEWDMPEPPPGRPKAVSAPLGGSAACEAAERGGPEPPPGRPKAASAPLGGSGPREAGERGGLFDPAMGLAPLMVDIVKRRGPPLAAPLRLHAQPPALRALLAAGAARRRTGTRVLSFAARPAAGPEGARDVDRLAVAA
ncbi:MAG: translesion DNA synthesis-associated protein ImuA [Ottowia sp.]|uniref:translesion DNA synthesis-associated protein ImuA n=1 Tax=Ottowia sp. TaxID=1898956 RepID=UPI0039E3DC60